MNNDFIVSTEKQYFSGGMTECPVCGKSFYVPTGMKKMYAYRKRNHAQIVRYACGAKCFKQMCEAFYIVK